MATTKAPLDQKFIEKLDDTSLEFGSSQSFSSGGLNSYLIAAGLVCSLSPFVYGYNISIVGDMGAYFKKCNETINDSIVFPDCIHTTTTVWSLVIAAFCLGGLIGALSAPSLADRFGRKKILIYHNIFYVLGTILLALASHSSLLILGRLFIGIASGVCTVVVPTYLSEIAPEKVRGILGNMFQAAIVVGIFVSQAIGLGISVESGWRVLFGIGGALPFIQMALVPLFVESPRWLAKQGYDQECINALKKLRKGISNDSVNKEANSMITKTASISSGQDQKSLTVMQLIKSKEATKSLIIGSISHACQQFSGINIVFYFGGEIIDQLADKWWSKRIFVFITVWNILMTAVSIYVIDRSGRRPLILISALLMVIADIALMISSKFDLEILGIISLLIFVGGFAIGLGPVPWTITGDIFPSHALAAGTFICVGVNWVANTIFAETFDYVRDAIDYYAFLVVCGITFSFFLFALKFFPETRGKASAFIQ